MDQFCCARLNRFPPGGNTPTSSNPVCAAQIEVQNAGHLLIPIDHTRQLNNLWTTDYMIIRHFTASLLIAFCVPAFADTSQEPSPVRAPSISKAKDPKKGAPSRPNEPDLTTKKARADFIADARNAVKECQIAYSNYVALRKTEALVAESEYRANLAMARVSAENKTKSADTPHEAPRQLHRECAEARKEALLPQGKAFIGSYHNPDEKQQAKETVAQWMTAIDAVGQSNADTEMSKFETLSNMLMLGPT